MRIHRQRVPSAALLSVLLASAILPVKAQDDPSPEIRELEEALARRQQELEQRRVEQELELQQLQQELNLQRRQQELERQRLAQEQVERGLARQAEQPSSSEQLETQVFELQYVRPSSLESALRLFRGEINSVDELDVLSVRASEEIMPAIEDVIRRLDVPPAGSRSVELTVHILRASSDSTARPLPETLTAVVEQMDRVFSYVGYELVDTLLMQGSATGDNVIEASGTISLTESAGLAQDRPTFYNFSVSPTIEETDAGTGRLQLNRLRFGFRVPVISGSGTAAGDEGEPPRVVNIQYIDNGIRTDLEIAPNQQVIVGKTAVGADALILVLSGRVLD